MFIKAADKKDIITGKVYRYYKLCESYRIGDKVRHRTIFNLGKLEEIKTAEERKLLADRIEQLLSRQQDMFILNIPPRIEKLAYFYYKQIKRKKMLAYPIKERVADKEAETEKDYQEVDLSSMNLEDTREIGSEWLCKQAIDELEIESFLKERGWEEKEVKIALLDIISRAVYPASEHKTAKWINDNSAVAELFDLNPYKINRFQLYRISDKLYEEKEGLEDYLSVKTNELFDLEDKIILYDLTNTYFEGRKLKSKLGKFSKSKDGRKDAKLVALALVTNQEGFVKYSKIYRGNISDCKTLSAIVKKLSERTSSSKRKAIIVIDAGIATEKNLKMLRDSKYEYVCVSRSKLKDYKKVGTKIIHLHDKKNQPIEVRWVKKAGERDNFLYVRSKMKSHKEESIKERFCQKFEEELENIKNSIHKKGGTKRYEKVMERIGRIKERYGKATKYYKIEVKHKDGITTMISWKRKSPRNRTGVYFIRTNIKEKDEKKVWDIYNTIRNIESCFRILKTDLRLRPICHKKDKRTMGHLHLSILAYIVVNTIRYRLKKHGLHHDWQNILRIMNTQKVGTITMEKRDKTQINIRICRTPGAEPREIYLAMGYKLMPFYRKKSVLPEK